MELKGKVIDFLGDSITEGSGCENPEENRYDNIIKRKCGLKKTYNYGIGGTRIAHQHEVSENPRHDLSFCSRAYDLNREADIIIAFGGTNDYGHGDAAFGTLEDKRPDTFCGAVDFLMKTLITEYSDATIVFLTPARRLDDMYPSDDSHKKEDARPLIDYVEVIKTKGRQYGIPVLDLYEKLPFNGNESEDCEKYVPDGLHPNAAGHAVLAEYIIEFLKEL